MTSAPPAQYQTRSPASSATGAAMSREMGIIIIHTLLVKPITRPCISGSILLCMIACRGPLAMGLMNPVKAMPTTANQKRFAGASPKIKTPSPIPITPIREVATRFLNPPHTPRRSPPITMPMPIMDSSRLSFQTSPWKTCVTINGIRVLEGARRKFRTAAVRMSINTPRQRFT